MLEYLLHKKFWLPIIILLFFALLLEILLKFGIWEKLVAPHSFLGNSISREKAIKEYGLEKIEWITIGDSKTDWGIDHGLLRSQLADIPVHIRMSFANSDFLAMQSTIDWSIAHMPNLKGVMIGITERNFGHLDNLNAQFKLSWPFRSHTNFLDYDNFSSKKKKKLWYKKLAIIIFYQDIKDFLKNSLLRFYQINNFQNNYYNNILNFSKNLNGTICKYNIDTLFNCIDASKSIKFKKGKLSVTERYIQKYCSHERIIKTPNKNNFLVGKMSEKNTIKILKNWKLLINRTLEKHLKIQMIILPESNFLKYAVNFQNANDTINQLIKNFENKNDFDYLDLRSIFTKSHGNECEYYIEPFHYNNLGKKLITERIINSQKK